MTLTIEQQKINTKKREAARIRKQAQRSRYKEAGLAEVLCRVPANPTAIAKLRACEKRLNNS